MNVLLETAKRTSKTSMDIVEQAILTELDPDLYEYVDEYSVHRNCISGKVPNFVYRYCQRLLAHANNPELPLGLA